MRPLDPPSTRTRAGQLRLCETVDIPSVSIRNPLLPQIFAHPEHVEKWYSRLENGDVDLRHVSISPSPTAFAMLVGSREKRNVLHRARKISKLAQVAWLPSNRELYRRCPDESRVRDLPTYDKVNDGQLRDLVQRYLQITFFRSCPLSKFGL